jgi:hypothetical protein
MSVIPKDNSTKRKDREKEDYKRMLLAAFALKRKIDIYGIIFV